MNHEKNSGHEILHPDKGLAQMCLQDSKTLQIIKCKKFNLPGVQAIGDPVIQKFPAGQLPEVGTYLHGFFERWAYMYGIRNC